MTNTVRNIVSKTLLVIAVLSTAASAVQAHQDIDPVVAYLRKEVKAVNDTKELLEEKVAAINRIEQLAADVIQKKMVNPTNPKSVLRAAGIFNTLNAAVEATAAQAKDAQKQIVRVNGVFATAEKGVQQGKVSQAATAVLVKGRTAIEGLKNQVDSSSDTIKNAIAAGKEFHDGLRVQDVVLPRFARGVRPTYLGVLGGYFPNGTLTQNQVSGYVYIINYDDGDREGVLEWTFEGGTISPASTPLRVRAGGTQRVDFQLSVPEGGKIVYGPTIKRR